MGGGYSAAATASAFRRSCPLRPLPRILLPSSPPCLPQSPPLLLPSAPISSLPPRGSGAFNPREIASLIAGGGDIGRRLDAVIPRPSARLVADVILELTRRRLPASRFVDWALADGSPALSHRAAIYDALVDNLGSLGDYSALARLLSDLSSRRHSLDERAFAFVGARGFAGGVKAQVRLVADALAVAGGSSRASGIHALVRRLCSIGAFDVAIAVIEESSQTSSPPPVSYFNVLVGAKCRIGDFRGAHQVFDEMRRNRCEPDVNSWNYILGCMLKRRQSEEACRLIEAMERSNCLPDSSTYKILICHACQQGNIDSATGFLDRMFAEGIRPLTAMHVAFIKGYVWHGRVADARRYVSNMRMKDPWSVNLTYTVLANELTGLGRAAEAGEVLTEMMGHGLQPVGSICRRVARELRKVGDVDKAAELWSMLRSLGGDRTSDDGRQPAVAGATIEDRVSP